MTLREKIAREIVVMIGFEDDPDAPPGPLTYEWTDRILALIQDDRQHTADLLESAADDIGEWAGYASAYFQEKHGLADDVEKYRSAAKAIRDER